MEPVSSWPAATKQNWRASLAARSDVWSLPRHSSSQRSFGLPDVKLRSHMWYPWRNHPPGGECMSSSATERSKHLLDVNANRIRELRERSQWSQLTLSCNAGVTQCTIRKASAGT